MVVDPKAAMRADLERRLAPLREQLAHASDRAERRAIKRAMRAARRDARRLLRSATW